MLAAPPRRLRLHNNLAKAEAEVDLLEEAADGYRRWQTPLGAIWTPPKNTPVFAIGEQLAESYTEGEMTLGPGDVVLDCGANVGDFVLVCLRVGVEKVIAIDPSPVNVEAMRQACGDCAQKGLARREFHNDDGFRELPPQLFRHALTA